MQKSRLEILLIAGVYLTLLTPLVIVRNPLSDQLLVTFFSQALYFQGITTLLVGLWIALCLKQPSFRPNWRDPMLIVMSIFLSTIVFSQLFSIDVSKSFWSVQDRMTGTLHYVYLFCWFLILHSLLREHKNLFVKLITFSCGISTFVSLIAFFEWLPHMAGRITSTLSNPNYLAAYLLIHIAFAYWLWQKTRHISLLALILLHTLILVISGSQGGILALALTSLLVLFFHFKPNAFTNLSVQTFTKLAAVIVLLTTFILTFGHAMSIGMELPTSVQERLQLWDMGVEVLFQKPLTGWGFENTAIGLDAIRDGRIHAALTENWYDRTHNQILDHTIATGLVGLIGFLTLWGTAFFLAIKKQPHAAIALTAIAIYLFFQFDFFYTNLFITIIFAALASTPLQTQQKEKSIRLLFAPILLIALMIAFTTSLSPFLKNQQKVRGIELFSIAPAPGLKLLQNASSHPAPYAYNARRQIAAWVLEDTRVQSESILSFLSQEFNDVMSHPHPELRMALAAFTIEQRIQTHDSTASERAGAYAQTMTAIAPTRPEGYAALGVHAESKNDYLIAAEHFADAKTFAFNQRWSQTYSALLAGSYAKQGAWEQTVSEITNLSSVSPSIGFTLVESIAQGTEQNANVPEALIDLTILVVNNQPTQALLEYAQTIFEATQDQERLNTIELLMNQL